MKRIALYFGAAVALAVSCSVQEEDFKTPQQDDVIYYASFEQPAEEGTRVYANEDLLLRWTADDRVSIFGKNTFNQQYKFLGETGDNSGGFSKVDGAEYVTGNSISHTVSVYPYQESTKISENETLTLNLPAEQHYAQNTFGLGANAMVSVSEDNVLQYKSVGGFLRISLYGEGVTVSSIALKGNNGEKLAGKATVTMPLDGTPTAVMSDDATDVVTLVCDSPVTLGATAEESKDFWFVVPPVTFSKGFTVTVSGKGGIFEKSTEKTVTIERNKLSKMAPIEVKLTPAQPRNVIYYTSSDGVVVTPNNPDVFGASILSNEYVDGRGVITFDGDLTSIGDRAFQTCSSLTSITIPDGVTSIGDYAFHGCSSLTSITIPNSVTNIGVVAFGFCTSLTSITIPDGVMSIRNSVFDRCTNLTSITIPDSVTSIESFAFSYCESLTSFTIPNSVTDIGDNAFNSCTGLTSITIPNSLTILGDWAFAHCTSLTSITIPDSMTSIVNYAFYGCTSLTSITIPDSVTSIEHAAFGSCTSLTSITIPDGVTNIGSSAFSSCTSLASITIPDSVTSIGGAAFDHCTSLASITIPDGVMIIGVWTFNGCTSLSSITIPDSVTSIESFAFYECKSLLSITIPDSVNNIGEKAFIGCKSLSSITIPDSVNNIGEKAFIGCSSLTSITIKSGTPPAGSVGMFDNTNNAPIYVPTASVEAYKTAQYWSDYADRIQAIPSSSVPVPEAVDLGLPSGLKWASFNLGASKPEEYGDYYAWGETETYYSNQDPLTWKEGKKSGYSWSSYKWCMGDKNTMTKYCNIASYGYNGFTDTKTVLDPEDDAARANWGGTWRMPTDAEWTELRQNCTWTLTTQNGVNGRLVTASNGNSIFLPAAGYRTDTGLWNVGSLGFYWSSSLGTGDPYFALAVYCGSGHVSRSNIDRYSGFSVRPVCN